MNMMTGFRGFSLTSMMSGMTPGMMPGMGMSGMGMPGMGMPGMGMPGMGMPGMGADAFMGTGMMGGFGSAMANPMMGMSSMGNMGGQQMQMMMMMLMMMMMMQQGQGMGSPMGGAQGMQGMQGMQGGQGGGEIELQKGQTFTTPSGSTISWQGDEVKVNEKGGAGRSMGMGGAGGAGGQGGMMFAGAMAGPGFAMGFAGAMGMTGGCCGCCCGTQQDNAKPKNWRVWGDPHIDHPNGSKSDFDKKNALFTLGDGTRVLMGADNPKGVVNRVKIFLPNSPVNLQGFDPKQTSVMQDNNGHFNSIGTADQFMQGGFRGMF